MTARNLWLGLAGSILYLIGFLALLFTTKGAGPWLLMVAVGVCLLPYLHGGGE